MLRLRGKTKPLNVEARSQGCAHYVEISCSKKKDKGTQDREWDLKSVMNVKMKERKGYRNSKEGYIKRNG